MKRWTLKVSAASLPVLALLWAIDPIRSPVESASPPPGHLDELPLPSNHASLSPAEIIDLALARWEQIHDYRCTIRSANKRSGTMEENVLSVIYKRPGLFRHVVTDGASRGVILTYNGEKVNVRPGGVMSMMTVEMDKRDQRLLDGRGKPFFESDWGTELARLRQASETGWLHREQDETLDGNLCWVISVQTGGSAEESQRVWIEQKTRLLKRYLASRRGQTLRDASYSNVALNTSPNENEFTLVR